MEVTTVQYKHCDLVKVKGRVDSFTAPKLAEALGILTKEGRYNIALQMAEVEYVSSAGLRVMIDVQKTCKHSGRGEMLLVSIPKRIYDTLDLAGFVPLFRFFDDETKAVASF